VTSSAVWRRSQLAVRRTSTSRRHHGPPTTASTTCARVSADDRDLITSRRGRYPHADGGVEVRRIFHVLRSRAIETLNGQFKGIFDCQGQLPRRGLVATRRFILGAVLVYQLALLYRQEHGQNSGSA
jgi:hypothetical protein